MKETLKATLQQRQNKVYARDEMGNERGLHSSAWRSGSSNLPRKQRCHFPSIMRRFASAICSGGISCGELIKTFLGLCSSFLTQQGFTCLAL
jgi:hypothetical protein